MRTDGEYPSVSFSIRAAVRQSRDRLEQVRGCPSVAHTVKVMQSQGKYFIFNLFCKYPHEL